MKAGLKNIVTGDFANATGANCCQFIPAWS